MDFSLWNQYHAHSGTVPGTPEDVYKALLTYYHSSPPGSFMLLERNPPHSFRFQRGSALVSAFGMGSECRCRHIVAVECTPVGEAQTRIDWTINLKLFGLRAGKNAIIEECKRFLDSFASTGGDDHAGRIRSTNHSVPAQ
jgi:hypothetical protein